MLILPTNNHTHQFDIYNSITYNFYIEVISMGDLSNFEIYKLLGLNTEGYIFSVTEETEEEPIFHYFMITFDTNRHPVIHRVNNTIEMLSTMNLEFIPIDNPSPEIMNFVRLVTSTITNPNKNNSNNIYLKNISEKDIKLLQKQ